MWQWLDVTPPELDRYEDAGVTVVDFEGWEMVSKEDTTTDLQNITKGVRNER
jgi:hypothetical protein